MFFGVRIQSNDLASLQIRQPLVVAICEGAKNYLLHSLDALLSMILTERVVISGAINKSDVNRDISFSYKEVIDEYAADSSVAIDEWMDRFKLQMKMSEATRDRLARVTMIRS